MDYDYSLSKRVKRSSKLSIIFLVIIFLSATLLLRNLLKPKKTTTGQDDQIKTKEELVGKIRQIISNKPGTYSIFVSSLSEDDSFGINENTIFTAASVNKIEILAALYFLASRDETDLDRTITLQEKDIQDFGTGSIRYDKPGTVYSLKTLARLMMEKSDNTASYILGNQVLGLDKIQNLINEWGLPQTDMIQNKTSNVDQEKILRMIFEGKIASPPLTSEMLDLMDESDFENRIPLFLPKNIPVYHKVGTEVRNVHDVGIVDLPSKPYYLGVFVSDNPDEEDAETVIAEISKLVYEYFSQVGKD